VRRPTAAIDLDDNRVDQARAFGATDAVNNGDTGWKDAVSAMTDGLGVDVAIEAVGVARDLPHGHRARPPGETVANVGVRGTSVELRLQGPVDQRCRDHLVSGVVLHVAQGDVGVQREKVIAESCSGPPVMVVDGL
jgi:threonine dehydrogenase-like Zn-dependent dehydrogenase